MTLTAIPGVGTTLPVAKFDPMAHCQAVESARGTLRVTAIFRATQCIAV